jgi:hypothetical protein
VALGRLSLGAAITGPNVALGPLAQGAAITNPNVALGGLTRGAAITGPNVALGGLTRGAAITGPNVALGGLLRDPMVVFMLRNGILNIGTIDINNPRFLLMNLYLNVIFKTLLSNNMLKQKYDESKIQNKSPYIPLVIQEKYMISPPEYYQLEDFPKTKFNDIDTINKLNSILETKLNENIFMGAGASATGINLKENTNTRIKNKKNKFLIKFKNIKPKKNKTIKKKIRNIKYKNELKREINTKIKKYIKNYLEKKEKQLEILESQIINANNNFNKQKFNKEENKNKIKKILNSNINKKINIFNKYKNKINCKNKKNNTRKNY